MNTGPVLQEIAALQQAVRSARNSRLPDSRDWADTRDWTPQPAQAANQSDQVVDHVAPEAPPQPSTLAESAPQQNDNRSENKKVALHVPCGRS